MPPLLSVAEAQQRSLAIFRRLDAEAIPLAEAAGRVLAEAKAAPFDLPTFDNSSMDGFAVRAADVAAATPEHPVTLAVVADIPAGMPVSIRLETGQAARIMTGAPLPAGADAVTPVEDTDHFQGGRSPHAAAPQQVAIYQSVKPLDYIRRQGQDVRAGEVVLAAGTRLGPPELGLLAMLGYAQVQVTRRPRIAVLSSGDEILPLQAPLQPGKIYDSNGVMLAALVRQSGGLPIRLGVARDRQEAVQELLDQAVAERADLILSSAGVSVGAYDYVRAAVEQAGELKFWRVNMRPGKPLAFGAYYSVPFVGLPGNPVSAFVGYTLFVHPAIAQMQGLVGDSRPVYRVQLAEGVESDGRESYLRGLVTLADGRLTARLVGHQGSGNLRSLVQGNALLIIPSGVKSLPLGAEVDALMITDHGAPIRPA